MTQRTRVVIEPGVSVLHLIEGGSVIEYLKTGNVMSANGREIRLAERYAKLAAVASAAFDAAGNGDEALGVALINLGLVLNGEEPNDA